MCDHSPLQSRPIKSHRLISFPSTAHGNVDMAEEGERLLQPALRRKKLMHFTGRFGLVAAGFMVLRVRPPRYILGHPPVSEYCVRPQ